MLTLSTVPFTAVVAAVLLLVCPAYCAVQCVGPGGSLRTVRFLAVPRKFALPADCAPRPTVFTTLPLLSAMVSTTAEVDCGTLTAPVTVPFAASCAVGLVTSA